MLKRTALFVTGLAFAAPLFVHAQETTDDRLMRRLMALENKVFSMDNVPTADVDNAGAKAVLADFEVRLSQLEEENRKLYGGVEELAHSVEQLARKLDLIAEDLSMRLQDVEQNGVAASPANGQDEIGAAIGQATAPAAVQVPSSLGAQELYQRAYNYLSTATYSQAEIWFKVFLDRFPEHELADNSYYWLGEIFLVQNQPEQAVVYFTKGLQKFPKGAKAPGNLLKMGTALQRLEKPDHAKSAWEKLLTDYPDAPEAARARKALESL